MTAIERLASALPTTALAALALSSALAAPAQARTARLIPQVLQTEERSGVYADGRYVLLPVSAPGQTAQVRDDQTGQVKDTGCTNIGSIADGAGFGSCPASPTGPSLWRFSTGTATPVTGLAPGQIAGDLIGRQWVQIIPTNPVPPFDPGLFYNWHTGEQRYAPLRTANRDDPDLTTGPPLVRGEVIQGRSSPQLLDYFQPVRAIRLRVGGRVRTVRSCHSRSGCAEVTYSRGVISWVDGDRPYVYRVSSRRLFTIDRPAGYPRLGLVTHTASHLYLNVDGRGPGGYPAPRLNVSIQARIPRL